MDEERDRASALLMCSSFVLNKYSTSLGAKRDKLTELPFENCVLVIVQKAFVAHSSVLPRDFVLRVHTME